MTKEENDKSILYKKVYGSDKEGEYAKTLINQISEDYDLREKGSIVSNGIAYSQAYEYNQRKAINYSPPKNPKDDREVSSGLVHEKIISFIAIFLKYVYKRRIKCYDENGNMIKGMGKIYDLAIEYSQNQELFKKKIALIYWELFTQGNAFVLEDWEVKVVNMPKAYKKGKDGNQLVTPDSMDYTFEFLDGLTYEKGEDVQTRRAVSKVLDGRQIIFGNPEIEEIQDQPRITIEEEITRADAEAIYGTLKRWEHIPKEKTEIDAIIGDKVTLFDSTRHKNPKDIFLVHRVLDKENNKFNIFLNGIMMLPMDTPLTIFFPRNNYPISNLPAERLRGSIYSRSVPAKTKFNADFIDWVLKKMALKFEQGIEPALLSKGKYTLTRDMFRAGQVTHGVSRDDFEKVDPDNKGVTAPEFNFFNLIKEILESQTVNQTFNGELSSNATATEIATVDSNQQRKLAFLLDGIVNGFMDLALRRAETIESKYTIKQKETIVDGKKINVYQNFSINTDGIENSVVFDDNVGTEGYDEVSKRDELFTKSFKSKKDGSPTEFYLANPKAIRENRYTLEIEIVPELIKDSQLQMIQMFDEFAKIIGIFGSDKQGGDVSTAQLKKEYLQVTGRPDELFTSQLYKELEQQSGEAQGYNMGSMGKPTMKGALQEEAGLKK